MHLRTDFTILLIRAPRFNSSAVHFTSMQTLSPATARIARAIIAERSTLPINFADVNFDPMEFADVCFDPMFSPIIASVTSSDQKVPIREKVT